MKCPNSSNECNEISPDTCCGEDSRHYRYFLVSLYECLKSHRYLIGLTRADLKLPGDLLCCVRLFHTANRKHLLLVGQNSSSSRRFFVLTVDATECAHYLVMSLVGEGDPIPVDVMIFE